MSDKLLLESGSALLLESGSFLQLESALLDWSGWQYSRTLMDTASTSLSPFVVRVALASSNFDFSLAKSDGSDLRVNDVTSGVILPLWLLDYDSVAQTATLYYKAINTSHAHTLYYGNPAAPAVSNFAGVFTHGSGFDADWGDLTTTIAGTGGAVFRYPGPTSINDPRNYTFWRLAENPTLSITDLNSAGVPNPSGIYTGIREVNLIRDAVTNRVLNIGGKYYVSHSRRPVDNSVTIDGWMASSTSKYGPWSNFYQPYTVGTEHLNYPSSIIKVGSTYYMFVNIGWTNGGGTSPPLTVWVRTSTDLVTWTAALKCYDSNIFNDQTSGPCTDNGNGWVILCADGVYMLVTESYGSGHIWGCYGATCAGPPFTAWTALNGGNALVGSGPGWEVNGAANPKCLQLADGSYVINYNGSDTVGGGPTDSDWQHGYAYAANRGGPYTKLAANPVVGKPTVSYGFETSHFSWDEDGKTYFNIGQRFATSSSTASHYFLYAEPRQGGLLLERNPDMSDASAAGCLLAAGNFTAEVRSVYLAHRTVNSTASMIGILNSAAMPTPAAATTINLLRVVEIERNSHDRANAGDVILCYWDSSNVRWSWNGTAWTTAYTPFAADYAREIVCTIADDGTYWQFKVTYADDGSLIVTASVTKSLVRTATNRFLHVGDLVTDGWCQSLYLRYAMIRPYAAVEPAMVAGPLVGGGGFMLVGGGLVGGGLVHGSIVI